VFILSSDGRDADVMGAFDRYRAYLEAEKDHFPRQAHALATSEWYFDFNDHRCPHDGWVEQVIIEERPVEVDIRRRQVSLTLRLLGAYQDGIIELHYPTVFAYSVATFASNHADLRYDELRLSESGQLIHEIEWCGMQQTGRWLIEASDVEFKWMPKQ
jgi:hypothetical protein